MFVYLHQKIAGAATFTENTPECFFCAIKGAIEASEKPFQSGSISRSLFCVFSSIS